MHAHTTARVTTSARSSLTRHGSWTTYARQRALHLLRKLLHA